MTSISELLRELVLIESRLGCCEILYRGMPLYRIFRFELRKKYLKKRVPNYTNDSRKSSFSISSVFINVLYSLYDVCTVCFTKKKVDTIIFPHFRLFNFNGVLIEKFTDPLLEQSSLLGSVAVFQQSYRVNYRRKRLRIDMLYQVECLTMFTFMVSLVLLVFFYFGKTRKDIDILIKKIRRLQSVAGKDRFKMYFNFVNFYVLSFYYRQIFKKLKCKRIFVVNRDSFKSQIFAAHQLGLKVYELQHGVTMGPTVLYSGFFNPVIDPDYFLTFGAMWKGELFAMPVDRTINIGFAYKNYIQSLNVKISKGIESVLVISSPAITEEIVTIVEKLAILYPMNKFYFRTHPQENLSVSQKERLTLCLNVFYSDKSIESNIEILSYEHVIGTNSSVLFEALSLGKNVGRLAFGGLFINRYIGDDDFYYVQSLEDFDNFLRNRKRGIGKAYSDFEEDKLRMIL